VPGVEVTGFVSRERLRELYRAAKLFVYPSHEEGFGIPPLEAMACGAPVIATATGAIPEYGSGVVELIEPADRDALRNAMLRILRDDDLRRELRARGAARAQDHRWGASAARMGELLAGAAR
jgi:glycosyltransferase involved in cell wall biosynthesis